MLVVQKYGGTSVRDAELIQDAARRVADSRTAKNKVVVVVSAMGDDTDRLIKLAGQVSRKPSPRVMDELLTTGEMKSASLLAMAIMNLGIDAVSLTGEQAGIVTDDSHGNARILMLQPDRVLYELEEGRVVVVAGYQGVSLESEEVTTLGRGGSDTTAVALAAALEADICEIYTDVDGVFTADPRVVSDAGKLNEISYDEMLEMAGGGAQVLAKRAVELARRYGVAIHLRSSLHDDIGTLVKEVTMERAIVISVSSDTAMAKVTIRVVPDSPGIAGLIFSALGEAKIVIGQISSDLDLVSFTVSEDQAGLALEVTQSVAKKIGASEPLLSLGLGQVTIVGAAMDSEPLIAGRMFEALGMVGINILAITTSEISISCIILGVDVERAVIALHGEFELGNKD